LRLRRRPPAAAAAAGAAGDPNNPVEGAFSGMGRGGGKTSCLLPNGHKLDVGCWGFGSSSFEPNSPNKNPPRLLLVLLDLERDLHLDLDLRDFDLDL